MTVQDTHQKLFDKHKICVLLPTYNNNKTLKQVIDSVLHYTSNILIVNDGSTDSTANIITDYPKIKQLSYSPNRGKGWALRQGFKLAVNSGYEYAITIDTDGQHFAENLPHFIEKLEQVGPSLIIGARNMNQDSIPSKSSFGHKFSNFWFWVETGIKAPDTQSGYRLYPVKQLEKTTYFTRKFEFEIEVIVRAAWAGIKIESVPVSVFYASQNERVSHFRPFTDFTRISILNTLLVLIALLYINPRNFIRAIFRKDTYRNLKNELFNKNESTALTATSVAFGVFMGLAPIWGFQLLTAITLSILFRLNKALVILSANISLPPMIPFIIYLSYQLGAIWVGDESIPIQFDKGLSIDAIHVNFMQYIYGSITLALTCSLLFGTTTWIILSFYKKDKIALENE
jgi:glycosyltransferase involved in cell wall biosynthesis